MRLAAIGCVHGELTRAYKAIQKAGGADVAIMCGDVQACRHEADLESMSVRPRYRRMGDFHKYYSGKLTAPILTLIVGGNHEASAFFAPLPDGGWIAKNMWYVGESALVEVDSVRIAGLSGIYYEDDKDLPRFEPELFAKNPQKAAASSALFSAYHMRSAVAAQAAKYRDVDIVVTHDWPRGIEHFGDLEGLLARKPWFRSDVAAQRLGNPLTTPLLDALRPKLWISAHLHVYYTAQHGVTRFVALDKVLPHRHFLEIIDVSPGERTTAQSTARVIR